MKQRQHEEEARRAAAQAAARAKRLDQLATRTEEAWEKVAEWIETRRPGDYDLAVALLGDLQELARREGDSDAFSQRFGELRTRHQRKPTLQERFDQAGLG
jgi:predicted kinase